MRNVTRSIFVSCVWLLAVPAGAGQSGPKLPVRNVTCGETITASLRVANSLFDCPDDGLVVGAPGITIDLGGHRIGGTGTGSGIDNGAGHANVTVRNGSVRGFGLGVDVQNAAGNVITGLRVTADADSSDNAYRGNRAIGNGQYGFEITGGTGQALQKNTADENAGHGILSATGAVTLSGNRANRNGFANGAADGVGLGIYVPAGAIQSGNKAAGNDDARECESSELSCAVL